MELRQLRQLVALGETLNFRRAAARLNMAQPPLSISIRKLEQELGVDLFVRSKKSVSVTAAGHAAIIYARQALFNTEQLRDAVRESAVGLRGRLRIGFVGSATYTLLPKLLPFFRAAHPKVEVVLEESTTALMIEQLEDRVIDVGLVRLPLLEAAQVDVVVLERDKLVAAVPESHPLARRRRISIQALSACRFIIYPRTSVLHRIIMLACQEAGFLPDVAQEVTQVQTMLCLVESGLGVALVPAVATRKAPPGVKFVSLTQPPPVELGLVLTPRMANPLALNFKAAAQAVCRE